MDDNESKSSVQMHEEMSMKAKQRMVESGEVERLKELLRNKLVECGWRDNMKLHCKEVIRRRGADKLTLDELVLEITPKGRELVPDSVKKDLLHKIRTFLEDNQ